jgi:ribosomal protein S18 acetylase RimI-like enzyme
VEQDGRPVGRLYLARLPDELRVVDIALLAEHRGRGIGQALMTAVIAEADAASVPVRLHVELWNPAGTWYERLGFRSIADGPVYRFLERPARAETTTGAETTDQLKTAS